MGTKRLLTSCLGVWHCGAKFWAFCPTLIHAFCLSGILFPSKSILSGSAQGQVHDLPTQDVLVCTHRDPRTSWAQIRLCCVPTAAQRADVGGEAVGTSINHSQMLLQRLQELLRQGNASDVILRVQVAATDEVRVFHAHRLLLGLHSELFQELLSNQSEVVLLEPRDCAAVFDKFIRWGGDGLGGGSFIPSHAPAPPLTGSQKPWPLRGHCVH